MVRRQRMKLEWYQQLSPVTERCDVCRAILKPGAKYWRAVHEPDGHDEYGYNACERCKHKLPNEPEARPAA